MNAGKWIVIAFVLFTVFIGTLVTICIREDISLVSKDYYKEELAYEDQMKRMNNTSRLSARISVSINEDMLELNFGRKLSIDKGTLKLFRPSNSQMDRDFSVESVETASLSFNLHDVHAGLYRIKLTWVMGGKEYYYEDVIFIS